MSSSLCYYAGYGIYENELIPLLNEEHEEVKAFNNEEIDFSELIDDFLKDDWVTTAWGDDNGNCALIHDRPAYEPAFTGISHINEHFYKVLKPILKEDITLEALSKILDDVFDYTYC